MKMPIALGALLAACATSTPPDPAGPLKQGAAIDDTVAVALGKSALTRDGAVRVSFLEKLADSRCGIDAICIWAGDVGAVIRIETVEHAGEGNVHTAIDPRQFSIGDYQVSLVGMTPYPGDKRPQPTVAAVRVFRASQ